MLSQGYRQELQQVVDHKGWLKPAHLLRSIQLICYNWFNQKKHCLTPSTPDFAQLLQMITLNTYMLPWLPPVLHKLAHPRSVGPSNFPHRKLVLSWAHRAAVPLVSPQSQASRLLPALALNPPPPPTGGSATKGEARGKYIANLTPDPKLVGIVPVIKDLMGKVPPPVLDNGSQLCLSYHIRQGCWSACRRANTHTNTLTANEKIWLMSYLQTQAQKLQPTATPPAAATT
jgi:hypothetical protein